MLSKLIATLTVLFLWGILRRLREQRLAAEDLQQRLAISVKQHKRANSNTSKNIGMINRIRTKKPKGKYAAVSVEFTPNACDAVRSLAGQRFLAKDAPLMPLQKCPRRNVCNCFYRYHDDRRKEDERSDFNITFGIIPNYTKEARKRRRWYDHTVAKAS